MTARGTFYTVPLGGATVYELLQAVDEYIKNRRPLGAKGDRDGIEDLIVQQDMSNALAVRYELSHGEWLGSEKTNIGFQSDKSAREFDHTDVATILRSLKVGK
jgi:hypothetical protein